MIVRLSLCISPEPSSSFRWLLVPGPAYCTAVLNMLQRSVGTKTDNQWFLVQHQHCTGVSSILWCGPRAGTDNQLIQDFGAGAGTENQDCRCSPNMALELHQDSSAMGAKTYDQLIVRRSPGTTLESPTDSSMDTELRPTTNCFLGQLLDLSGDG